MCLSSSTPEVESYKTSAQAEEPDNGAAMTAAGRRASDKLRGVSTVLTSSSGVLDTANTQKNVLLGA